MPNLDEQPVVADRSDPALVEYRAVSVTAVVGLVLAFFSALAFVHPIVWCLPVIAAVVNAWALRRIAAAAPHLVGRTAALAGLSLALILGVAAPTYSLTQAARSRHEARQLVQTWFDAVQKHRLKIAMELMLPAPPQAPAPGEKPATRARDPDGLGPVRAFAMDPLVRAVEELGDSAQIRYLRTIESHATSFRERLWSVWAVTYEVEGRPTSFLVQAAVERDMTAPRLVGAWRIKRIDILQSPPEWLPTSG